MSNQPIFRRRLGNVSGAIFDNGNEEGRPSLKSVSLSKRFFDRNAEEWKTLRLSLGEIEVPAMIAVLNEIQQALLDNQSPIED